MNFYLSFFPHSKRACCFQSWQKFKEEQSSLQSVFICGSSDRERKKLSRSGEAREWGERQRGVHLRATAAVLLHFGSPIKNIDLREETRIEEKRLEKVTKKEEYFGLLLSDGRYRPIVHCRGQQSLASIPDFLPLRRHPCFRRYYVNCLVVQTSLDLEMSAATFHFISMKHSLIIRHNACKTGTRPAGLAPLLLPAP